MAALVDWKEVASLLADLYRATDRLEEIFPGRKFTLDGHLVGSVGEVLAEYMFGLELFRASTKAHDAKAADGRLVEIKITQGKYIGLRHAPQHLLVLYRPKGGSVRVIYNGPGMPVWKTAGDLQSNGQRSISLKRLAELDKNVSSAERLEPKKEASILLDAANL
jgi:hypothetical protein